MGVLGTDASADQRILLSPHPFLCLTRMCFLISLSLQHTMLHSYKGSAQTPDVYLELIADSQSSCSDLQLMIKTTVSKTCFGSSLKLYYLGRQIPKVWFGSWVHNLVSFLQDSTLGDSWLNATSELDMWWWLAGGRSTGGHWWSRWWYHILKIRLVKQVVIRLSHIENQTADGHKPFLILITRPPLIIAAATKRFGTLLWCTTCGEIKKDAALIISGVGKYINLPISLQYC